MTTRSLAHKLTAAAEGNPTNEAASFRLTTALDGRLVDQLPLAWDGDSTAEVDWPSARATLGHLSGGERRIVAIADSLATGAPVNLAESLTGLDETSARATLRAFARALGVRIHGGAR